MITFLSVAMVVAQQRVSSLAGTIKRHPDFESKVLRNKRNILVYLPPQYDQDRTRRFQVLYMADGQNCFDGMTSYIPNQEWQADEAAQRLCLSNEIDPVIIVAIDNAGGARADEYLPTKASAGRQQAGGKASEYAKFLLGEVMPVINSTYRTKLGPENTGVCGSSFGGILSLYLVGNHPKVFGKAAVVSPSLWWDNQTMLKWSEQHDWKQKPRMWLDIGTKEGDAAVKHTAALADILTKKGFKPDLDLVYLADPGAEHNEKAWARRFPMMLKFLFPKKG